eukprot:TRINITY_DN2701_c0_g1_i1.p1 TRINITY_DN2701_c0_g1~~TRINITY_DN2701_c0_g1_i1.p1  ORF type:complete len:463 (-),score=110.37 TRINITY_DN2701_c0_g1_i1:99-1487(-)
MAGPVVAEPGMLTKSIAEFVGTYLLVFTVGCNVLGNAGVWAAVSIACVLMVSIYALGGISGANFNPAVSWALGVTKAMGGPGMRWKDVAIYTLVQISAGMFAALSYTAIFKKSFDLAPAKGFGPFQIGLCEFFYTFMLVFVVLNTAVASKNSVDKTQFYGLAIGFVIIAGAYGAGAVTGGCFNPAVTLAIDATGIEGIGRWSGIYIFFQIIGATLAAALFEVVHPEDFGKAKNYTSICVSEFVGTFMLVLTVGFNVLGQSKAAAFSIAASLMCMIYALGDVSGAHFNPAVTVAILVSKRSEDLTGKEVVRYITAQIGGAICAAYTYKMIFSGKDVPLGPVGDAKWQQAAVAEFVFTFLLSYIVLAVAVSERTKSTQMFGLAIGSCVTIGGFAVGGISGASLNPAVSWGLASTRFFEGAIGTAAAYTAVELLGGVAAGAVFKVTHDVDNFQDMVMKNSRVPFA